MPVPNALMKEVGLWPKYEFPTPHALALFRHLIEPGSRRLYIQTMENGVLRSRTTNSESSPGFSTLVDVRTLIAEDFLELDEEATRSCGPSIMAYSLSMKGREALVQISAYEAYESLVRKDVPQIHERLRRLYIKD